LRCQIESTLSPALSSKSEYGLTEKEIAVLQLIVDGLANREIAVRFGSTVKNYVSLICSKLNVKTRTAAMKKA
jgi:DNA-binding NarL/FixJ family response regulator